jgi:hypothetical protein
MSEDLKRPASDAQMFVAVCNNKLCQSTVQ